MPGEATRWAFRCLILDHDDTTVDATRSIHYPAHVESVKQILGSEHPVCSLEDWFRFNHQPGISKYLESLFGAEREGAGVHDRELAIWRQFMENKTPDFCPGMLELLRDFRSEKSNYIVVVSHSPGDVISRFYAEKGCGVIPDAIFGWSDDHSKMKPEPFPVEEILRRYPDIRREDCLVVDDLTPGLIMARRAGVRSVAAGWCHGALADEELTQAGAETVLRSVAGLRGFLSCQPHSRSAL